MPDHLDFVSMRLFASVVEHGNIAQAARANNIAASAISKRISDLEARVGLPLIQRLRDGVEPTEAGLAMCRHIAGLSLSMDRLHADLSDFREGMRGRIRLWANTSAITQFLPEDLKDHLDRFPEVKVDLWEDTSSRIAEAVQDGVADLGIFSGHIGETEIARRVYRRDTLMVIVPAAHPLKDATKVTFAELAGFDHVGLQAGSSLQDRVLEAAREADVEIRIRVQVLSFDGMRRMVEAGLGVGILPQGAVLPFLVWGGFKAIELDESWAMRTLYLGFRELRSLPLIVRHLADTLAPVSAHK